MNPLELAGYGPVIPVIVIDRLEDAVPMAKALVAGGVVCSFRKPDSIRLGLGALYTSHEDIWTAVARLRQVLESEVWRRPEFAKVAV